LVVYPEDKSEIIELMKKKGLWEQFAMMNYPRFQSLTAKGEIDDEIKKLVEIVEGFRLRLSKRKDIEE
jgi:hypothetical protein